MSTPARNLISVGIDVGTTTTQVVFSHLVVHNTARTGQAPRIHIQARDVLYQSPIYPTPLLSPQEVDAARLSELVHQAYRQAGVSPEQIETGAVIITGEAARAQNADTILQALAHLAGDFVVTVAGPNLEAQIAGRGSGAAAYSARHYTQVVNVDVGGGTANAAVFRIGRHISSSAMAVGGRQIEIEPGSGLIRHIPPPGRTIIQALDLPLREGARAELAPLRRFCDAMADLILDLATGQVSELGRHLQLTPPLQDAENTRAFFFSGGVGHYFYHPIPITTLADVARHHDVGPLLAQSLRLNPRLQTLNVQQPRHTLRATVLGAASQTVTLSGSTIWAEQDLLPLRNLPVIRPHLPAHPTPATMAQAITHALQRWDIRPQEQLPALALDLPTPLDFQSLQTLAQGVVHYARHTLSPTTPLVLIVEQDYAQVLGQAIKALRPQAPLVVIDQVGLGEGDFIDIGEPMLDGRVVPLSVKTLIFYE